MPTAAIEDGVAVDEVIPICQGIVAVLRVGERRLVLAEVIISITDGMSNRTSRYGAVGSYFDISVVPNDIGTIGPEEANVLSVI